MKTLVVVPTLGERHELLRKSMASIMNQSLPGLEVVTVAPPGRGVEAIAAEMGARFLAEPATSRGLSGALNTGLQAAGDETQFFGWLGDDDLLAPGSLVKTTEALRNDPNAVLAYGWCDYIDEDDRVVFRSRAGRLASAILPWGPNLIPQPGSLMRLAAVNAVGGLDDSVRLAMDLDLFLRLRKVGGFVSLPETLACFRWHQDSATVRGERLSMEESDQLRMKYMSKNAARAYAYLRWPGRLALWLAKRRVDRNSARAARRAREESGRE